MAAHDAIPPSHEPTAANSEAASAPEARRNVAADPAAQARVERYKAEMNLDRERADIPPASK